MGSIAYYAYFPTLFFNSIMPIYAYRCNECGFIQDFLQKISDPVLTVCPSCGKPEFKKQVTAAGFQLKGSGWYATDFKGADKAPSTATETTKSETNQSDSATKTTHSTESTNSTKAENSTSPAKSDSTASDSSAKK